MNLKQKIAASILGAVVLFFLGYAVVGFVMYPADGLKVVGVISATVLFVWAVWTFIGWALDEGYIEIGDDEEQ